MVQREKSCMAYDLHPVFIPYSVSMKSKKLKCFNEGFFRNVDLNFRFKKSKIDITKIASGRLLGYFFSHFLLQKRVNDQTNQSYSIANCRGNIFTTIEI